MSDNDRARRRLRMVDTLTVAELAEQLQDLIKQGDGQKPVLFAYDYGDISHTQAVQGFTEATVLPLEVTAYSPTELALMEDDEGDPTDLEEAPVAVILR